MSLMIRSILPSGPIDLVMVSASLFLLATGMNAIATTLLAKKIAPQTQSSAPVAIRPGNR